MTYDPFSSSIWTPNAKILNFKDLIVHQQIISNKFNPSIFTLNKNVGGVQVL